MHKLIPVLITTILIGKGCMAGPAVSPQNHSSSAYGSILDRSLEAIPEYRDGGVFGKSVEISLLMGDDWEWLNGNRLFSTSAVSEESFLDAGTPGIQAIDPRRDEVMRLMAESPSKGWQGISLSLAASRNPTLEIRRRLLISEPSGLIYMGFGLLGVAGLARQRHPRRLRRR